MASKQALINEVGTKLANLIYFLKSNDKHTIIFSQWDDMLHRVGAVLDNYGIRNVFCRGNIWQRDKAIREFNQQDNIKVIMLSSESAASGTNLTKAKQVILLDPVYGSYEFRKNTEWQAVGRAHRLGQTSEVDVVRFIIKDTVESDIYNMNREEDAKHVQNIKILESMDDDINISAAQKNEIEEHLKDAKAADKPVRKPVRKAKPAKVIESDSDDDDY